MGFDWVWLKAATFSYGILRKELHVLCAHCNHFVENVAGHQGFNNVSLGFLINRAIMHT